MSRGSRRRLALGLPTILGLSRWGYFVPYRNAAAMDGCTGGYPEIEPLFRAREPAFANLLAEMASHSDSFAAIGSEPPPQPRWRQSWFPRLDAAAAYTMVRARRPRRIVEVGCGHSTRFFARAIADGGLATTLTGVDPAPRAHLASLPVDLRRQTLQSVDRSLFAGLAAGDIVAIDSSHVLMPGSDVDVLLNRVLPTLPAGVLVHIHDVFLPDPYPHAWGWRGYNEQLGVCALMQGGAWAVLWSSRYVATRMADQVRAHPISRVGLPAEAIETSLWLAKRGEV